MKSRWLISIAAFAPACLFPSLDGLDGSDASLPDVAAPDAPADVAPEVALGDAGCDAALDAGFCASFCVAPLFCDDFDVGGTFARWSDGLLTKSGAGSIRDGGLSQPHLAQFTTNDIDAGIGFAECRTKLPAVPMLTIDADVNVTVPPAHFGLITLETIAAAPYEQTRLVVDVGSKWDIDEDISLIDGGSAGTTTTFSASVPTGWFHVTFIVDLTAHTASLVVDGTPLATKVPISAAFVPSAITLRTGIYFVSAPASNQKVLLDNVVVHAG